ncbi:unnamed protein product [Oncorhynchus mykiss]|uniref:Link domain-containing protein n=1 Tax=Oncorhynchus mykiss TaxID=8022 RepID=A0A060X6Y6_ONCMY|nr:unnamed protein product [Oncorhynchus mykiss]
MLPALICALVSLSLADNFDTAYPELEHYRTIYVQENGPQLSVVTEQSKVVSRRGGNATLPCKFHRDASLPANPKLRIKWTKLTSDYLKEIFTLSARGFDLANFLLLVQCSNHQATCRSTIAYIIKEIRTGTQAKKITSFLPENGIAPQNIEYQSSLDTPTHSSSFYLFFTIFYIESCSNQKSVKQIKIYFIFEIPYYISNINICENCAFLGFVVKQIEEDTFLMTSSHKWRFYYLIHPSKLTYDEAVVACQKDGAQIAKVGQMYAAWKLLGYDRCDAGWLADGSVRYPITRPRRRCSPTEAAVRFNGYPDKKHKLYGVYCFKGHN